MVLCKRIIRTPWNRSRKLNVRRNTTLAVTQFGGAQFEPQEHGGTEVHRAKGQATKKANPLSPN